MGNARLFTLAGTCLILLSACSVARPKMSTRPQTTGTQGSVASPEATGDQTVGNTPDNEQPAADPAPTPTPTPTGTATAPAVGTGMATGKLTVDFTPVDVPGTYSPRNVLAVFVTDSNNKLIKTLYATGGGPRVVHLKRWQQLSNKTIDGFTGATRNTVASTGLLTWDMKDRAGAPVPNGNYKIWFETATSNVTAINPATANEALAGTLNIDAAPGYKALILPVVVGPAGSTKQETTNPSFTKISIIHAP